MAPRPITSIITELEQHSPGCPIVLIETSPGEYADAPSIRAETVVRTQVGRYERNVSYTDYPGCPRFSAVIIPGKSD